jgi:hypothetical protein
MLNPTINPVAPAILAIPSAGIMRVGIFNFVILSTICGIIFKSAYAEAIQTSAKTTDKMCEVSDMRSRIIPHHGLLSVFIAFFTGGHYGGTRTSQ